MPYVASLLLLIIFWWKWVGKINESFGFLVDYPNFERFISPITDLVKQDNTITRKIRAEEAKIKFSSKNCFR